MTLLTLYAALLTLWLGWSLHRLSAAVRELARAVMEERSGGRGVYPDGSEWTTQATLGSYMDQV